MTEIPLLMQVNKDTFYEDEKRETHMIDKEKVATENSVEAAAVKENKSDHDVEIEVEYLALLKFL